ncbi:DUF4360 domain-containing protein [Bdellovibrio sp. HCB337]|uniref:DUF4360 domain-containing protein n=1 Tax=Bdellovibrio sp. HCB337 TaxID=3394358 RepID=UPI0039A5997B
MKPAWKELLYAINGAALFLLVLLATEVALGQTELPPSAKILSVQTGGAGCEATNTAVSLAPDLQAISVLFSDFTLEVGAGTARPNDGQQVKNCQIRVEIETPAGWSLAVKSVDYRGFAHLPAGASARHRFSYRTDGMPPAMLREAPMQGPFTDNYFFRLEQPLKERIHTPCGPPNIRLRLGTHMVLYYPVGAAKRTGEPRETAMLSLDSADVSLQQDFQLEWKRCGKKNAMK